MSPREVEPIQVVAVLPRPLQLRDVSLDRLVGVDVKRLVRDLDGLLRAIDEIDPSVIVVATELADELGFDAIDETVTRRPGVGVLAVTSHPARHDHVARAMRAGASGFVSSTASSVELADAIAAVGRGDEWLPPSSTRAVLIDVADDLDVTASDRRSQLSSLVIGLIPLAGGLAAVMSLLWRRYLGSIGVRPVDLAIDPSSRVVDALFALSTLLGVFGLLLFVGTWLDLFERWAPNRRIAQRLIRHRRTSRFVLSVALLVAGTALTYFAEIIVALFLGPVVGGLWLARVFDLDDGLPAALQLARIRTKRAIVGGIATILVFLAALSAEVLLIGPVLEPDGASGFLAPSVLGFKAQPMTAMAADGSGEPNDVLYLGGNADLYVLVDPCRDDEVELVSVGSTRLVVIDRVRCD